MKTSRKVIATAAATLAIAGIGTGIATAAPATSFGNGTHVVGADILPGIYTTQGSPKSCYWERLSGLSGDFDDILANDFSDGKQTVQILPTDTAFKSNRCGTWVMLPPPAPRPSIFGS